MAEKKVTDPKLIEQLNTGGSAVGKKVTDPRVLHMLNGGAEDDWADDGDIVIPDSDPRAGLPIPGTRSEAEASGQVQRDVVPPNQRFGMSSSDTPNPLPAIAATGDAMFGAIPIAGPHLQAARDQINANIHGGTPEQARADIAETVRQNPAAETIGTVAGKTLPYAAAGAMGGPIAGALGLEGSLGMRFLMGGLSTEAIEFGDELAHGKDPATALRDATTTTALSAPFFAVGGRGSRANTIKNAPTVNALEEEAGKLYRAAEDSKLVIAQPSAATFINGVTSKAMKGGLDETLTPGTAAAVKRMQTMTDRNMSIQDAMLVRKLLGAAASGTDDALSNDRRLARGMIHDLDNFLMGVAKPGPGGAQNLAVVAGNPAQAAAVLEAANKTWAKAEKGKVVDQAIELAISNAGKGAGDLEQPLRNEFGRLEREIIKGNPHHFSESEKKLITKVANGGGAQWLARQVGKITNGNLANLVATGAGGAGAYLASGGDPLITAAGAGAVLGGGAIGRALGSAMGKEKADFAGAMVRSGAPSLGTTANAGRALSGTGSRMIAAVARGGTMTLADYAKNQIGAGVSQ